MARHPGCEAVYLDNGREVPIIPVCMGGAAIKGAMDTIIGCNDPSNCFGQLKQLAPGLTHVLDVKDGRVVGHLEVRQQVGEAAGTNVANTNKSVQARIELVFPQSIQVTGLY